jgi:hypothetical protein
VFEPEVAVPLLLQDVSELAVEGSPAMPELVEVQWNQYAALWRQLVVVFSEPLVNVMNEVEVHPLTREIRFGIREATVPHVEDTEA